MFIKMKNQHKNNLKLAIIEYVLANTYNLKQNIWSNEWFFEFWN